jgi:hypothetical protein
VIEHSPLQLAWHCALQVADGGVPMQLPWQRAPQLALHWAVQSPMQVDELPLLEHCPMHTLLQLPWQSAEHEPSQLKLPGLAEQLPMQLAEQLPVHEADGGVAWQLPMQPASS